MDGLVAIVGDNMILHSDVLQQAQIYAASQKIDPVKRPYLFEKIYDQTFENILNQYVVLDVAKKDTNLIVSDVEVDRALEQRLDEFVDQAGSVALFEEAVGLPFRQIKHEYWSEIRNMMFIERYKFSQIQSVDVGRTEVNDFYFLYQDSIPLIPENYTFSAIEIPFEYGKLSEERVYSFLDSLRILIVSGHASFDSLARIYSQDEGSSSSGGGLGFTSRGSLVFAYEEAAYALQVGDFSLPVRSQFGYHLIKLVDRRGEEISSQHILIRIPFSAKDKDFSLKKAKNIYNQTYNDPFLFDSLSMEYGGTYKNFSGTYSNITQETVPSLFIQHLNNLSLFELSLPIEMESGYALLYLYKHDLSYVPNLEKSWNIIYEYAKQEKQNRLFQMFITKIRSKSYIKILN